MAVVLRTRNRSRRGTSYVELVVALLILSICLVPAARALPGLLAGQRDLEVRYQLSLIAQEKLEAAALALQSHFAESDQHGDLASQGHPEWRYSVRVEVQRDGDRATIRSQAWADENADGRLDPGEPQVRFDTTAVNLDWSP